MYKYSIGDRFEVTVDILIPFSPFSDYRIAKGTKGTILEHKNTGKYQVEMDDKNSMSIKRTQLDESSDLIGYDYFPKFNEQVDKTEVEKEDSIIKMTADIWNEFKSIEQTHPSDIADLADAIHDIQKIIAVRIARRMKPDQFVSYKKD